MFYSVFTLFERLTNLFELNKFLKIIKKKNEAYPAMQILK